MIPEGYVADLQLRLGLYRRLADLKEQPEIEAFAAELIDRFRSAAGRGPSPPRTGDDQGALPPRQCREGRRRAEGRGHRLPRQPLRQPGRPDGLDRAAEGSLAKVRPDQKVVIMRDWDDPAKRLEGHRSADDRPRPTGGAGGEGGGVGNRGG